MRNVPKIGIKELSASELTKDALMILKARGYVVWRQQNTSYGRRQNIATPGIPDIIGYDRRTVRFVGCEVKKKGDTFSKEQKDFLRDLKDSGGIALYVIQENGQAVIKEY